MPAPATVLVLDIGKTNAKAVLVDGGDAGRDRRADHAEPAAARAALSALPTPRRSGGSSSTPARTMQARHGVGRDRGHRARRDGGAGRRGRAGWRCRSSTTSTPARTSSPPTTTPPRPAFEETGSPRLPAGLNLGAQLFWQFRRFPEAAGAHRVDPDVSAVLDASGCPGCAASERTSLGCHTDLWDPHARPLLLAGRPHGLVRADAAAPPRGRRARAGDRRGRRGDRARPGDAGALRHPRFQRLAAAAPRSPAGRPSRWSPPGPGWSRMAIGGRRGRRSTPRATR